MAIKIHNFYEAYRSGRTVYVMSSVARLLTKRVRIPPRAWMSLLGVLCYVGRRLYDGPFSRAENFYRLSMS